MDYELLGKQLGRLVNEKQAAYGDSFGRAGDVLRLFYPEGISIEQFDDALCVVRIVDKLFRVATDKDALGESPYLDIAGYGLLGAARDIDGRTNATKFCYGCGKPSPQRFCDVCIEKRGR